jgi:hypothetical protein
MQDYLKSGRQAVRWVYVLITGLAITKAIDLLFRPTGTFVIPTITSVLYFAAFFLFISRFLLGAYRVLSYDIDIEAKRGKILIDAISLFVQSALFYVYALNFTDFTTSQWIIVIICVWTLIWLCLLAAIFGIIELTSRTWIFHDMLVPIIIVVNLIVLKSPAILFVISIVSALFDYLLNADFFFSFKQRPGLRIFVAGPYGDKELKEVIDTNVEKARHVGKELALKGHYPFIPHTMLHGWEIDNRFTIEHFKEIDFAWLDFCDALYFIAESPGANVEKELAIRKGLQIFTNLDRVPTARGSKIPKF